MLADKTSLTFVYHVCAFLPAVGLLGGFLPTAPGKAARPKTGDGACVAALTLGRG